MAAEPEVGLYTVTLLSLQTEMSFQSGNR